MEKRNLILLVPLILALTGAVFIVKGSISLESRDPITINVGMNSKYKTIQSAVDDAIPGDKIVVENGTYSENVVVGIEDLSILGNGSVKIMAKDTGPALIVIMDDFIMYDVEIIGSRVGDVCFIRSNRCDIRDVHISGSGGEKFDSGINVKGKEINLQNINITNCSTGFLIQTVGLRDCPYGIAGDMPVLIQGGDWGGHILYCNASNNSGWGFFLRDCVNLTLGKCRSDDNMIGFQANNARRFQIVDCNASRNVRSGFIINASKEIWIPWMSSRENGDDGIVIQSCSWMCLDGGNFQGNARNGVNISGLCSDLYFIGMNITDNGGIGINCGFSGKKNAYYYINYNRFFSNDEYGIRVSRDCPMINISRNEFIDNNGGTEQAYSQSACAWYQTGGYDNVTLEGNHWSDWTSPDEDNDGIVDVPYNISGDSGTKDMYPIVERKMGYYDPYRSRPEWPGLDFLMGGSFFLCKVDPIKNPSEGYSSDQIDWYIEGEYIGTGDIFDFNPPSDEYTLTMQYKDPDGTYREISATFRHHYSENNSVLPRTTFIIGVVLLSISIALAILNVVILRKARKKDIEFSQNRFTIVENERNIFFEKGKDDIALIMDKAVESRTLKPKYSDLKRELDKKFASDQIDCDTYRIMIEILHKAYCQYPLSAW